MSKRLVLTALIGFAGCGGNSHDHDSRSTPSSAEPAQPAPSGSTAPPTTIKCVTDGGRCSNMTQENVCPREETGPEWGCAENEICCLPK